MTQRLVLSEIMHDGHKERTTKPKLTSVRAFSDFITALTASPFSSPQPTSPQPLSPCLHPITHPTLSSSSIDSATTQVLNLTSTTDEHSDTPPSTPSPTGARREPVGADPKTADSCSPQGAAARLSEDGHVTRQLPTPVTSDKESAANGEEDRQGRDQESAPSSSFLPRGARPLHVKELADLPHIPHRLHVTGQGRCPIASAMLACGFLADEHDDPASYRLIDQQRIRLGQSMLGPVWNEEAWVRAVPNDLRAGLIQRGWDEHLKQHVVERTSYHVYHALLTDANKHLTWLDETVFYLAGQEYDVGVFLLSISRAGGEPHHTCRHIRAEARRHIVIVRQSGHYESVQYDGLRVFSTDHDLVKLLSHFSATQPPVCYTEDDNDLYHISQQHHAATNTTPIKGEAEPPKRRVSLARKAKEPKLPVPSTLAADEYNSDDPILEPDTPARPSQRLPSTRSTKAKGSAPSNLTEESQQPLSKVRRRSGNHRNENTRPGESKLTATTSLPAAGGSPLSPADIAAHGELYDFISFGNVPQWIGMCTLVLNAYRIASQGGNRNAQDQAIEDLLMLPQRVLTRTNRGGGDGRRLTHIIRARCRDRGAELRARYQCMPAKDHSMQLTVTTTPLLHQPAPPRAESNPSTVDTEIESESDSDDVRSARSDSEGEPHVSMPGLTSPSSAATLDVPGPAPDALDEEHISNGEEDVGGNYVRAFLRDMEPEGDPHYKAAKRAQHHMRQGHTRKAAQVLHSTATMADLRQSAVQDAIRQLHPALPVDSVLPSLPADSPQMILEDDEVMCSLLRASNNGSASGPSGWGGNLLSSLVESDLCRAGIIALLKDIINGNMSERARQMLLSSRLVALNKTDGGHRPIAIGELFYRLAGVIVVRKITKTAAALLAPHQFGVGIPAGAERILHSLQHLLTDQTTRVCLLKVDISNAFNSCDRARMLRELYSAPELSPLYRIADFGYSAPSQLLLQRCEGLSIPSSNGVRQGDPISAVLFCLYMREVMTKVTEQADVQLYGFFDDLNVVGKPDEVMKAFTALQQLLPEVSLQCNTSKSHFSYFHQEDAPLMRSIRKALAEHNIQLHEEWMEVVGAIIGRDEQAIRAGITATLGEDHGRDAFFYRLQLDVLTEHSCVNLLRQCAVPKMNYLLRCLPPPCIGEEAKAFDKLVLQAAKDKMGIHGDEGGEKITQRLQARLRHGGFGMTSALKTSPAAYLGSLAAVSSAAAFEQYTGDDYMPLASDSLLHGWITSSMKTITDTTPASSEQLPESASSFFHHFSKSASSLQHSLSILASDHSHKASLKRAHEMKKKDGGLAISHLRAISAPHAWAWKTVVPSSKELELTSAQYKMAARLNLGLMPLVGAAALGKGCPLCHKPTALRDDCWHFLTCKKVQGGEQIRRHNEVVNALYKTALVIGAQVAREPVKLSARDGRRPDLQIVLPGRHILTDVAVCHPLTQRATKRRIAWTTTGVAREKEWTKRKMYSGTAALHGADFLPFVIETCGGM
ncbi:MAG: uncharacterized protein JWP34_4786, partial [Massilia sp.]|nr:uncharacterized protein [Massilia sp.]